MNRLKLMPRINSMEDLNVNQPPGLDEARELLHSALATKSPDSLLLAITASELALDAADDQGHGPDWDSNQWDDFVDLFVEAQAEL